MKKFLFVLLFSVLIPIQNSSAVSPSLEETIKFLINGDNNIGWAYFSSKEDWSIDDQFILKMSGKSWSGNIETHIYDLNKVIVSTIKPNPDGKGFISECKGNCRSSINNTGNPPLREWWVNNGVAWKRNLKALSHLFSNFCTGAKSVF